MIGKSLGPYTIVDKLGAGGMGEVYLAEDTRLGRKVAIKVLPGQFAGDPERLARFEQEARAAAALNHPHIAAVFDVGSAASEDGSGETHYMVQEHLEGQTLRTPLDKGALPLGRALALALEIGEALRAAHGTGIVHRDLKPDNIFITADGHAKVLDFGLAKLTEVAAIASPGTASMSPTVLGTVAGQVIGTAGYMAPEQVAGDGDVDHRADLFAFGCVLYQMVGGAQPFRGKNVIQTLDRVVNEDPTPIEELNGALPVRLKWILDKCLAKDPARRYQSAAEVIVDVREIAREVESGTFVPLSAVRAGAADPSGPPVTAMRSPLVWALAVVAVGALGLAVWTASRQRAATPPEPRHFELSAPQMQSMRLGDGIALAISADGRQIVTRGIGGSDDMLFHRSLSDDGFRPLPGSRNAFYFFLSPAGDWVAYFEGRTLKRVSLRGAGEMQIAEITGAAGLGGSWGRDGRIVYATTAGLWEVPEAGGQPRQVLAVDEAAGIAEIANPDILPGDNAALVQVAPDPEAELGEMMLAVVDLASGDFTPLGLTGTDPSYVSSGHVLYQTPDGVRAVAFDATTHQMVGDVAVVGIDAWDDYTGALNVAVSEDGTLIYLPPLDVAERTLLWVDRNGVERRVFDRDLGVPGANDPRLSADGRRIVLTSAYDIYVADIDTATATLLAGVGQNFYPIWSPGGRVSYSSTRLGKVQIYTRRVDSNESESVLLARDNDMRTVSWSSATNEMLVRELTAGGMDLLVFDPEREEPPRPLLSGAYDEISPSVSPDGRWMVYLSDETGADEIYVASYPVPDQRVQVSNNGGTEPLWAPDGSELFYWQGNTLMAVTLETEPQLRAARREALFEGSYVRYRWHPQYDVHPDGDRFLMIDESDNEARIRVVLDWFSVLRPLAPGGR